MAWNAKGAEILKRALATAFDDRKHVIGVTGRAQPRIGNAEFLAAPPAGAPGQAPQSMRSRHRVLAAKRANSTVALEYLLTDIGWAGAHAPVVDAVVAAKRPPRRLN